MSAALAKTDYPLCAERFIVLLKAENQWRKLFSVQFERGRNGIGYFVHLPYFAHSQGILRGFDFDVPPGTSAQINFTEGGVTTTERLKYAHHSDGNAHFSQDGKAFTTIRSRTPPLQKHSPHLFTLNFWGADSFKVARDVDLKARTANRAAVGFVAPNQDLPASDVAARIVGRRFSISRLRQHSSVARGMNYAEPIGLLPDGQQPLLGLMLQPRDLRACVERGHAASRRRRRRQAAA